LSSGQAARLVELLDELSFWDAPYRPPGADAGAACKDAGHWIVEAIRPGSYQLIARDDCGTVSPLVAGIRDYLLSLAGMSAAGIDTR
jgi:hypothetical protein